MTETMDWNDIFELVWNDVKFGGKGLLARRVEELGLSIEDVRELKSCAIIRTIFQDYPEAIDHIWPLTAPDFTDILATELAFTRRLV